MLTNQAVQKPCAAWRGWSQRRLSVAAGVCGGGEREGMRRGRNDAESEEA
jgi:hypothetical protein